MDKTRLISAVVLLLALVPLIISVPLNTRWNRKYSSGVVLWKCAVVQILLFLGTGLVGFSEAITTYTDGRRISVKLVLCTLLAVAAIAFSVIAILRERKLLVEKGTVPEDLAQAMLIQFLLPLGLAFTGLISLLILL